MSRKNLLSSLTERKLTAVNSEQNDAPEKLSPAMERNRSRGAFGAITKSIDDLAEQAKAAKDIEAKLLEGSTVVELATDLIDVSFIEDRLGADGEAFAELVEAVRERGQDSPILVRPHPEREGRYMVVFGHRRLRAAKALQRPVRAVVKNLSDRDHVIAQGQENSARANLSFIEKAMFAKNLIDSGYDREVVMASLSIDKTNTSKLLSVANDIPEKVVRAVGAAPNYGRDTWYKLAQYLREDANRAVAFAFIESKEFSEADTDQKLTLLLTSLTPPKPVPVKSIPSKQWVPSDRSVRVVAKTKGKTLSMDFANPNGRAFGEWISNNLEGLYEAFRKSETDNAGD